MANIQHVNIPEAQLHEPKGVSTAAAGTVYVADSGTSGAWATLDAIGTGAATLGQVVTADGSGGSDYTSLNNMNKVYINGNIDDLSSAESHFFVMPLAGDITNLWCAIDETVSGGDTIITTEIGGVAVTNGSITIAGSSVAGTVDAATPTALNTVAAGQAVEFVCDGGTTTTSAHAHITVELDVS